jgi:hypothetical protein
VVFHPAVTADSKGVWTASIPHLVSHLPTRPGRTVDIGFLMSGDIAAQWRDGMARGYVEGILEKESHDLWPLRKWQIRLFRLDLVNKTLSYQEEGNGEIKGEYELSYSSYLSFVNIRSRKRNCELVVSGYSRGDWSYLYLAAPNEETINMWFSALRTTIKVEDTTT